MHLFRMNSVTNLSVIAVRPLESPSWLCRCRNWRLVCVFVYCWIALRLLISVQIPRSLLCSCSCWSVVQASSGSAC